ncbi:type II toxin-antitoxin system VapC family toxin [Sphingobium sp. TCM1]|uniref:type II toxin-antitoxin system VapC family toxin n=1 Tax=Sphingobium sp. TCM1 TaxID=453246 RepID=UPI0007F48CC9|nr:type II toxin-antitoxin system VapC family toxin [Sphingobium sp. TCM1]OAN53304.1 twitching motility protein PilT [Sphingobium sp. TCM1]
MTVLRQQDDIAISAATLTKMLIVAGQRGIAAEAETPIAGLDVEIVPVTPASARRAAAAYARWGKGAHPASLNFGDCFAYELARRRDCPLLFVGGDFAQTDVMPAL